MNRHEATDLTSSWSRERERFHRARTLRLLVPAIPPAIVAGLVVFGVLDAPESGRDRLAWLVAAMVYGTAWVYLIRDARRFVLEAAELDERYRELIGEPIPPSQALPFTPPSYPPPSGRDGGPVIAVAGRRIDARTADVTRFPLASVGEVRERLGELFARLRPSAVVCSAACGADLLALDAAESLGIRRRVVLPFDRARFRHGSVTDRPGNWGRLYDRILDTLAAEDLIVLDAPREDEAAYIAATEVILDHAHELAVAHAGGAGREAEVLALVVWEGRPRGSDDMTAWFRDEAVRRGMRVEHVSTL